MRNRIIVAAVALAVLCAAAAALAGPRDAAINVTRLGGDSAAAQPYITKFLRYLESEAGWPAGSGKGSFLLTRKEALSYIESAKPGFGMIDPPLYFEIRTSAQLQPILQVESKDLYSERLHVVVKDPAFKTLADLKGKRLWSTIAEYPRYLSKVVLGGQVDAASHFELKQIGQALKGVRAVLRGDCDATLLDDEQLAKAKEIAGGGGLRTVYSSPVLPPIPVVVFGATYPAADREALVKAFKAMCGTSEGGAICKEMHIQKIVPFNSAAFGDAQKRYGE